MINIIVAINREWLEEVLLFIFGYIMLSIIGVLGAYYVLEKLPNPTEVEDANTDLLDSDID